MPSTCWRALNVSLSQITSARKLAVVYLDAIVIIPPSVAEPLEHVNNKFKLFRLSWNLKKCSLCTETIDDLNRFRLPERSEIASHIENAAKELKSTENTTKFKSSLDSVTRSLSFPSFARIESLLGANVQRSQLFTFLVNEEQLDVVTHFQQRLITLSLFSLPYAERCMIPKRGKHLFTDACKV